MKIQRRRTRHASSDSNSDTTSPIQSKGTTMFVKMPDSNAYFPINVRKKTIRHLLEAIQLKCPSFLPYSGMFSPFDYTFTNFLIFD